MKIIHGDMLEVLGNGLANPARLDGGHSWFETIFADIPDNLGLEYGEFDKSDDELPLDKYLESVADWLCCMAMHTNCLWLSFNARYSAEIGRVVSNCMLDYGFLYKPCVQVYTFGQHNKNDFGTNHRPLWRIYKSIKKFYPENILVKSWRQENGDSRANPDGRVPGDVFDMQYPVFMSDEAKVAIGKKIREQWTKHDLDELSHAEFVDLIKNYLTLLEGSVFDFPRVTGNSKQRCWWFPTQLHEDLVERCIKFSTKEGDTVCDPFAGSGTTLRVCKRIGRDCVGIERSKDNAENIADTLGLPQIGETNTYTDSVTA